MSDCAFSPCAARMPAIVRLRAGDRVTIKQATLENKGYEEEEL